MPSAWERMWAGGLAPGAAFDAGRAEPALVALLAASPTPALPVGRALVPGCGRGYAVAALADAGYDALGVDIAPTGVAAARAHLAAARPEGGGARCRVERADFFEPGECGGSEAFDLVYDCTFLCAIPPERRAAWAERVDAQLRPGGELVALVFPAPAPGAPDPADAADTAAAAGRGPPFAISPRLVERLLAPRGFERVLVEAVPEARRARAGREFITRWRKPA